MTDQPRPGLFSSLTLGRASRSSKPPVGNTNETLTHPLLGASTSSLNLSSSENSVPDTTNPQNIQHKSTGSWSARPGGSGTAGAGAGSGSADMSNLPYKPRQKHGGGIGSAGSATSMFGASGATIASPTLQPVSNSSTSTSPVTPTTIVSGPPTTSTSTSNTFALPPSTFTSDAPVQADHSDVSTMTAGAASNTLTSRLQLQSLKAAAQKIGLGNGSMGMSMIDAIFDKGQLGRAKSGEGGDWGYLLRLLMSGKAILLLPTTPSSSLPMTPQTLRDHIAFLSPPVPYASSSFTSKLPGIDTTHETGKEAADPSTCVIVTLSGLVGTLNGTFVTFESIIPVDSPLLHALRDATTRQSVLSSLRPTQAPSSGTSAAFPSCTLSPATAILPFPPASKSGPPPSIVETKEKEKVSSGKLGRINPFASLFGGGSAAPSPVLGSSPSHASTMPASPSFTTESTLVPERPLSPSSARPASGSRPSSPSPSSPKPSLLNFDHGDTASILSDTASMVGPHGEGYQVTAYTVSRPIRYAETHKSLTKAVRTHVKDVLAKMPEKVIDKVIKLALANVCPIAHATGDDLLLKNHRNQSDTDAVVTLDFSDPTTTGERLQDFMEGIYDDLITHHRAEINDGLKRKGSGNVPWGRTHSHNQSSDGDAETAKEKRERERAEKEESVEKDASNGTEKVEAVICRLLYNRLFSPLDSDDGRHDEALASRIAALNMLELSLDHLGLITQPEDENPEGGIARGLTEIVDRIGDELQKLSGLSYLTPRDKAEVLIKAHKIVVDGLANMPNVELRPEGEPYRPPTTSVLSPVLPEGATVELPTIHTPDSRSGVSSPSSHPLALEQGQESKSTSPAASDRSDPLTTIDNEATPYALQPNLRSSPSVPQLVLSESGSNDEPTQLQEAMSDSVMTVTGQSEALSREVSSSSHDSVPPPKPASTKPGTSGADLILPIIIYSVVKSNPPQLASQLMYLRRYRSAICLTGEASYAIVNLTAVVEFIEHVDLAELGLGGDSDKVMSIDDLSPIGLNYLDESNADAASIASASSRLRGRVFQVGELAGTAAGSANKVITGVMDSSWTALRGLMGTNPNATSPDSESVPSTGTGGESNTGRPGMRPRQASTFSLASVTASVASIAAAAAARNRSRANSRASEHVWQGNQELQEVSSRPASVKERENEYMTSSDEDGQTSDEDEDEEGDDTRVNRHRHRRSKSGASATSHKDKDKGLKDEQPKERVSLSNRLASIGVLGRLSNPSPSASSAPSGSTNEPATGSGAGSSTPNKEESVNSLPSKPSGFLANFTSPRSASASIPPPAPSIEKTQSHGRRSSLLGGLDSVLKSNSPRGSISSLPLSATGSGPGTSTAAGGGGVIVQESELPIERFMNCEMGDIKLSEIGPLLRDYRRLGLIVNGVHRQSQTPP